MIIKYDKCNFEKLEIRKLAGLTYNIIKSEKKHILANHIWGDSETFFPIDVSEVGVNLDTEINELYMPKNTYKHQDIWYNISILPNMVQRQRKFNLSGYTLKKVANQYYFGIYFITDQFKEQKGDPLNHKQISILFEKDIDIKHLFEHNCRYFFIPVKHGLDVNDTAYFLAETCINFYDKYHSQLIEKIIKYAPKFLNHSGYIYE